jgi:hypothetical protein
MPAVEKMPLLLTCREVADALRVQMHTEAAVKALGAYREGRR